MNCMKVKMGSIRNIWPSCGLRMPRLLMACFSLWISAFFKYYRPNKYMKNSQHHWPSEKCKLKSYWHTILPQKEMIFIRKTNNNKCWQGCGGRSSSILLIGMETSKSLWKSVWGFIKKLKMKIPFDPAIHRLGIFPQELKSSYCRDTHVLMMVAVQCIISIRSWKQGICPSIDE